MGTFTPEVYPFGDLRRQRLEKRLDSIKKLCLHIAIGEELSVSVFDTNPKISLEDHFVY
jgi:hypothetical protein